MSNASIGIPALVHNIFEAKKDPMSRPPKLHHFGNTSEKDTSMNTPIITPKFTPPAGAPEDWIDSPLDVKDLDKRVPTPYASSDCETFYWLSHVTTVRRGRKGTRLDTGNWELLTLLKRFGVSIRILPDTHEFITFNQYNEKHAVRSPFEDIGFASGTFDFVWKEREYTALIFPNDPGEVPSRYDSATLVFAETTEDLRTLTHDLANWNQQDADRILVVDDQGAFRVDTKLRDTIRGLTWDDIVLDKALKEDIRMNVHQFFEGDKTIYKRLGLSHKRGFLFIGQPGCGKSMVSKIFANTIGVTFIYVTSLNNNNFTPQHTIKMIYEKAAEVAPCIVLFEDLDTQITEHTRTVFLNTLDGFGSNDGVLTIATTNHPQNIDEAILNRPSRFDRKWVFPPPTKSLRHIYVKSRLVKLWGDDYVELARVQAAIDQVAAETKGFNIVMLQELVVSACYIFAHHKEERPFEKCLLAAVEVTKAEVKHADARTLNAESNGKSNSPQGFRRSEDDDCD